LLRERRKRYTGNAGVRIATNVSMFYPFVLNGAAIRAAKTRQKRLTLDQAHKARKRLKSSNLFLRLLASSSCQISITTV